MTQEHWLEIQNIFNSEVPDACAKQGAVRGALAG